MKRDNAIFDIIEQEHQRQLKGIELIASENFVSDQVMQAMGSCLTNKYAEGYPGKRYYGGCEVIDQSEQIAIDRIKEIFGAEWANVQPHSGAQANMAVFMAVLNPGDKFLGLNLSHGGHLSHGSPVNFSGLMFQPLEYGVKEDTGYVDYDMMEEVALRERPKLIIGGASAYSREWDYARMRKIADEIGAIFMIDMAHPAGLIAAGLLDNPLKYAILGEKQLLKEKSRKCQRFLILQYSPECKVDRWNTLLQLKPFHSEKHCNQNIKLIRCKSRKMPQLWLKRLWIRDTRLFQTERIIIAC